MRENYTEVIALIQKSLEPLLSKLDGKVDRLADKVDELARNRVTREDMDKLRSEMHTTFVAKDPYEVRHANLISRDTYLEGELKRIDNEMQVELQRLQERLDSGKQQIEDQLEKQAITHLNDKERTWVRLSQALGIIAVVVSIIGVVFQHVRIQ